jgi:hypothetical protein
MSYSNINAALLTLGSGAALLLATVLHQHLRTHVSSVLKQNNSDEIAPSRKFGRSTCRTLANDVFELREQSVREEPLEHARQLGQAIQGRYSVMSGSDQRQDCKC